MARQGREISDNVRGYLAGLLDLKGNAYTTKTGLIVMYITGVKDLQMQRDLVHWIGGGSISTSVSEGDRRGCTEHCGQPHIHFNRTTVRYSVTGYRAACVLHTLEPSLFTWRAKFANPYAEAMRAKPPAGYSDKLAEEMTKKGWEIP